MDLDPRRRRARRRLAAVAFLSNISLESDNSSSKHRSTDNYKVTATDCKTLNSKEISIHDGSDERHRRRQKRLGDAGTISLENISKSGISSADGESIKYKNTYKDLSKHVTEVVSIGPRIIKSHSSNHQDGQKRPQRIRVEQFESRCEATYDPSNRIEGVGPFASRPSSEIVNETTCDKPIYSRARVSREIRFRNKRILLASSRRTPLTLLSSLMKLYNNCNNDSNQRVDDVSRSGQLRGSSSSVPHRSHKSSIKRQSSKRSDDKGKSGNDASRQHSDPTNLFALMHLEKPGLQDTSYAAVFAQPARPIMSAHFSGSNLIPSTYIQPQGMNSYFHKSPNTSPQPQQIGSSGEQFFDFQHIHQPIYGSSNITARPMSHHLAVLGPHTTGHCGCFRRKPRVHDSRQHQAQTMASTPIDLSQQLYHAHLLDDPDLVTGKHATVLAFPSYISSVIEHVKPTDVKRELNERFKARYPNLQLTLSKLRSIKREMYQIGRNELQLDYLVIAQAYVYFEKLCLKHVITKHNRKLCAGASLLISAKLNDIKGPELKNLIEHVENSFRLKRRDIITVEFGVIVALDFALHIPPYELLTHYERLIIEG